MRTQTQEINLAYTLASIFCILYILLMAYSISASV